MFDAFDVYVEQEARLRRRRTVLHPGAAYLTGRVVKGDLTSVAPPDVPAEDALVEVGAAANVGCGDLNVRDLSRSG
jgi:hypothetical protein